MRPLQGRGLPESAGRIECRGALRRWFNNESLTGVAMIELTVNGEQHRVDVSEGTPFLWVLREDQHLGAALEADA